MSEAGWLPDTGAHPQIRHGSPVHPQRAGLDASHAYGCARARPAFGRGAVMDGEVVVLDAEGQAALPICRLRLKKAQSIL